ncbi:MAG: hypothetical protein KF874_11915 [Rhizobiaceae bacterium]|nr:hypothetical protein [Rhizobiaceae bacterium]
MEEEDPNYLRVPQATDPDQGFQGAQRDAQWMANHGNHAQQQASQPLTRQQRLDLYPILGDRAPDFLPLLKQPAIANHSERKHRRRAERAD